MGVSSWCEIFILATATPKGKKLKTSKEVELCVEQCLSEALVEVEDTHMAERVFTKDQWIEFATEWAIRNNETLDPCELETPYTRDGIQYRFPGQCIRQELMDLHPELKGFYDAPLIKYDILAMAAAITDIAKIATDGVLTDEMVRRYCYGIVGHERRHSKQETGVYLAVPSNLVLSTNLSEEDQLINFHKYSQSASEMDADRAGFASVAQLVGKEPEVFLAELIANYRVDCKLFYNAA